MGAFAMRKETDRSSTTVNGQIERRPTFGFGVPMTTDPHHFIVDIPQGVKEAVKIVECLGMEAASPEKSLVERVILDRTVWNSIRSEVQRAFNLRLKEHDLKTSVWKVGENPVDRLLGKELCVLAWAVEKIDMDKIPVAVRNWLALRPEERWWLFGMTSMSTGGVNDGHKGWRLALRHALGDVAQHEVFKPQLVRSKDKAAEHTTLSLFEERDIK